MDDNPKGVVARVGDVYTKEALKANDGKEVPLTKEPGGPVIGTAKLHWVEETGVLEAEFQIEDPDMAEFLQEPPPNIFDLG